MADVLPANVEVGASLAEDLGEVFDVRRCVRKFASVTLLAGRAPLRLSRPQLRALPFSGELRVAEGRQRREGRRHRVAQPASGAEGRSAPRPGSGRAYGRSRGRG